MKGEELKRIEEHNNGELPESTTLAISVTGVKNPEAVLNRTKEVMTAISQYAYATEWPSDEEWKVILPTWFVESMTSKTSKDRDNDENLYHFESWIANIKDRAWLWYSSKIEKDSVLFILETLSIPYLFSTLVYILYSQGIPNANILVKDSVWDQS
ncbi:MAG TPA: hypothetical protein VF676_06880 [Flavobacterium sp.]|jgi:hypothetical protein